ncbi:MAG: excinuclease ABC subunit UvrB [Candidatus Wallbacteria bacterium]|nr:excinuclease ABC subunit UvrB [Candidatus Wallbacteria bacterium]
MTDFKVRSDYEPAGDQPRAIGDLAEGVLRGDPHQVLLGVTGSGKTFVLAKMIEAVNRPALVVTHNKTLAAQLYNEFKEFFPQNSVSYFISYYDYYQPEAYIPSTGTYIEKDSDINEEIDRLRHVATRSVLERRDTLVVASVSCIYGLGSPEHYMEMCIPVEVGQELDRDAFVRRLVEIQYARNDVDLSRGRFRVRGDRVDLCPISSEGALRVEFFGDEVERITEFDVLTGKTKNEFSRVSVFPAQHYVTPAEDRQRALGLIEKELEERVAYFKAGEKHIEAQRIYERTMYDLEMIREIGYCKGIENYSRHLSGRQEGQPPATLIDYFPKDSLIIVDESHVTLPQVQGMYRGDRSRKETLVDYGFRLPSAFDNRPLRWEEFSAIPRQRVYVSATPADYELGKAGQRVIELIVRPTGLVDPEIEIRPSEGQIDDLIGEVRLRAQAGERVLVTTLTKKMAQDLTAYLADAGVRVQYMHSEIAALDRTEILRNLRLGVFDCLVGINLLREGLDLPEVSLVAILDADKEGFLRSTRSLIQTCGRAARNVNGKVILYADKETDSIRETISECNRRREIQLRNNQDKGIEPRSVMRPIRDSMKQAVEAAGADVVYGGYELPVEIDIMRERMNVAASELRFEEAAKYRDKIAELQKKLAGDILK